MPRKKKTETAPAAEVKTEATAETVKEITAEAAAPAEKPMKKTATKKAPAAKKTTKAKAETKTKAVKETAAVEPTAKAKTAAKPAAKSAKTTAPKEVVKLQFGSDEFDIAEIKKAVDTDRKGKFKGRVKILEIYIKPEEKAAYYVINSDFSDKIIL